MHSCVYKLNVQSMCQNYQRRFKSRQVIEHYLGDIFDTWVHRASWADALVHRPITLYSAATVSNKHRKIMSKKLMQLLTFITIKMIVYK